jgi:plasmid stabilization system protein ParE
MKFDVLLTEPAEIDIREYAAQIAFDSPRRAQDWVAAVLELIESLAEMPFRFPLAKEQSLASRGYRSVAIHSHRVLFRINETRSTVLIVRVLPGATIND